MWAWTPRIVEVKLLEKHTMDMYEHVVVVATEQGTRGRGHLRSCSATGRPPLRTMHIMFAKMYTRAEFVRVIEEEGLVDVHREMQIDTSKLPGGLATVPPRSVYAINGRNTTRRSLLTTAREGWAHGRPPRSWQTLYLPTLAGWRADQVGVQGEHYETCEIVIISGKGRFPIRNTLSKAKCPDFPSTARGNTKQQPKIISNFIQVLLPNQTAPSHAMRVQSDERHKKIIGISSNVTTITSLSLRFCNLWGCWLIHDAQYSSTYIARPRPLVTAIIALPLEAARKKYGISWFHAAKSVGGDVHRNAAVALALQQGKYTRGTLGKLGWGHTQQQEN
ncbi:hypothetical protein EDC04DRAFT_2609942 [Pisolithus marmoratus]|nr:hypothetical protein EDC04DRAFT_2609942 [Pisolithus marmoratus]